MLPMRYPSSIYRASMKSPTATTSGRYPRTLSSAWALQKVQIDSSWGPWWDWMLIRNCVIWGHQNDIAEWPSCRACRTWPLSARHGIRVTSENVLIEEIVTILVLRTSGHGIPDVADSGCLVAA